MTLPDEQVGPALPTETAVPIVTQLAAVPTATQPATLWVATTTVVRSAPSATPTVAVAPAPTTQSAAQPTDHQDYQLCGQSDATIGQAIGQFIAGRNFSAQLVSRSNGCASLTIKILPGRTSSASGSHQSTHLSVTANARNIDVDIVSENGVTRASVVSKS